jgi:5,10-methylenetetrahydromethanopterin reductase
VDFGICVASAITDIDYVVRAEELGFSHAWMADSQMLWSDCYAALALAADRTSTIKLGTGVAIAGTRPAPVHAAGIATINCLAPGRTFFGTGAGNTATRVMGLPPLRIAKFSEWLAEVVPLVRGDEAMLHAANGKIPIRHIMPDRGFVNFADEVPVYVSGFGPRSLALAGRYGDGAVLALPHHAGVMDLFWEWIESGAQSAGRSLDRDNFYTTALTTIVVLEEGESATSARVKSQCGAMAMSAVHFAYDQWRNFEKPPPAHLRGIWEEYTGLLESYPEERRHQRIHAGHNCWVLPEEEIFLTEEVLRSTCMIGTAPELIDRLRALEAAGLDQVMILPNLDTKLQVLEDVARELIPTLQS